jgi:hypothetical protein
MAFRFLRRFKIAPGLTLNLSKSGVSFSMGVKGAKYTVGPQGKHVSIGIPGSGLFYTKKIPSTTFSTQHEVPASAENQPFVISPDFIVGNERSLEE